MSAKAPPIQRYLNQGPDVRHLGEKDRLVQLTIFITTMVDGWKKQEQHRD